MNHSDNSWECSRPRLPQRRCNDRQIFAYLLAIAFLLFVVELCVVGSYLLFPPRYEVGGQEQRTIRLPFALAVHEALPMSPTLVF